MYMIRKIQIFPTRIGRHFKVSYLPKNFRNLTKSNFISLLQVSNDTEGGQSLEIQNCMIIRLRIVAYPTAIQNGSQKKGNFGNQIIISLKKYFYFLDIG